MFIDLKMARVLAAYNFKPLVAPFFALVLCLGLPLHAAEPSADPALTVLVGGQQRSDANKARDRYRHPLEVLTFFGVKADSSVVEIEPAKAGYWVEILAPYLKDRGRYTASGDAERDIAPLKAKAAASPELYGLSLIHI